MTPLLLLFACSENELIAQKDDNEGGDTAVTTPDVSVTPEAVDFGAALDGTVLDTIVTVTNRGDGELFVSEVALSGTEPALSLTTFGEPWLAPSASRDLVLTWTAAGPVSDVITVASDDPDDPEIQVPVTGGSLPPAIALTPETWDFGELEVGEVATVTVNVASVGDSPLTISSWDYAGSADLSVIDPGALASLPLTLPPGESTDVVVQYAPLDEGGDEGALLVYSDDPVRPDAGASQWGSASEHPCRKDVYTVRIMLTADDAWEGWLDETAFTAPNQRDWTHSDTVEWELGCGPHTLALAASDQAYVTSGVIAVVWVEDEVRFLSGPDNWKISDGEPEAGWQAIVYDDSAWKVPEVCADTSPWGTYWPAEFYTYGAQWIWWTSECRNLGKAWFRLNFSVP